MPPKRKLPQKGKVSQPPAAVVDYTKYKVNDLKEECKKRNLEMTGRKNELIKRLQEFHEQNDNEASGKKIKQEEETEQLSVKDKLMALAAEEKRNKKKNYQIDSNCSLRHTGCIVDDFDCMLNQTNIGANNNKFYVIQMVQDGGGYYVWNRWGRVGEIGQSAMKGPFAGIEQAEKEFKQKFKDKTKNDWDNRVNFKAAAGKYALLEMDDAGNASTEPLDSTDGPERNKIKTKACTLDKPTQALLKLIFNHDMFKEAMAKLNLDVKKMPLGKLSKTQIAKGFDVLEEIEKVLKTKKSVKLQDLTSQFYTVIPHNFGRQRPPIISDAETVQMKMDMLAILGDIEIAQSLQKSNIIKEEPSEVPHPLDVNYNLLSCGLKHVDAKTEEYKIIDTYVTNTSHSHGNLKLLDVWEVDRDLEGHRFSEHKHLGNRKLLWHGTNVAVVVAILKSGLRIMPHSGGRVGRGIYFASEHAKSVAYVGPSNDGTGIMFLSEVALGNQHVITRDDSSLIRPPKGFDSVLAQGRQEPDPSKDIILKIDSNDVIVPQGKPKITAAKSSSFQHSEYLIYDESQCRIRYLLKFKFR